MYPPLPPPPAYAQHHQHRRYPPVLLPHMHPATVYASLQAWNPNGSYNNRFPRHSQYYQPPLPPKLVVNPRVERLANAPAVVPKAEKPEKAKKAPQRKENGEMGGGERSPRPQQKDNQAEHVEGGGAVHLAAPAEQSVPKLWSQDRANPSEAISLATKTSSKPRSKELKHLRSNQETHERRSSSSSDSSSDDSSSTDTEDEEAMVLKRYYGFESIDAFICDADYGMSDSTDEALPPQPSRAPADPDYRKLFRLAPDAAPFHPANVPVMKSQQNADDAAIPPPHMMWWPGDWKCSKCGNHNFSYRETCKRCREGRLDDAGYVFTTAPC